MRNPNQPKAPKVNGESKSWFKKYRLAVILTLGLALAAPTACRKALINNNRDHIEKIKNTAPEPVDVPIEPMKQKRPNRNPEVPQKQKKQPQYPRCIQTAYA